MMTAWHDRFERQPLQRDHAALWEKGERHGRSRLPKSCPKASRVLQNSRKALQMAPKPTKLWKARKSQSSPDLNSSSVRRTTCRLCFSGPGGGCRQYSWGSILRLGSGMIGPGPIPVLWGWKVSGSDSFSLFPRRLAEKVAETC